MDFEIKINKMSEKPEIYKDSILFCDVRITEYEINKTSTNIFGLTKEQAIELQQKLKEVLEK